MNNEWLDEIKYCDFNEKDELKRWCDYIGYDRYYSIYKLLDDKCEEVSFKLLKAVAKYEFNLSDYLHSVIKFVELRFRAFLVNQYDFEITKHNYITKISAEIGDGIRELDSKTHYENNLGENTTFIKFIEKSGMDTLFKIVKILSDDELDKFSLDRTGLENVMSDIKSLRNDVAHSQILLNSKKDLKKIIVLLLKLLPSTELKKKSIEKLKEINNKFEREVTAENKKIKKIAIILTKDNEKEIGL